VRSTRPNRATLMGFAQAEAVAAINRDSRTNHNVLTASVVLYRTFAGENQGVRPPWYSKALCLRSLLASLDRARQYEPVELLVLHDGPLTENPRWSAELIALAAGQGRLIHGESRRNSGSFLNAVKLAAEYAPHCKVLFAEDDYLWLPEAILEMTRALDLGVAHYVTGYDHPDRYVADNPYGPDLPHYYDKIHLTPARHWRAVESTCMTFMAAANTIKEDMSFFERYYDGGRGIPYDRGLFRDLQGLLCARRESPRLLIGPMPSLNTHVHVDFLAPVVNWQYEASNIDGV
jgi:hypothetical protein